LLYSQLTPTPIDDDNSDDFEENEETKELDFEVFDYFWFKYGD